MVMSNYMDLLGMYAPWFLILFMVVPMTLAELVLCSEIFSLLNKEKAGNSWPGLRKGASICLSIIFIFLFIYLVVAYIPTVAWKGPLDRLSIYSFLAAIIPAVYLLFIEIGIVGKAWNEHTKVVRHVLTVFLFVALTHLAMVFGMIDPQLGGYVPPQGQMNMHMNMNGNSQGHMHMNGNQMPSDCQGQMNGTQMPDNCPGNADNHMQGNGNMQMNGNNQSMSGQHNGHEMNMENNK